MQTTSYMVPPLTTIRQPAYEMGQRAAELLLRLISKESKPVQKMMDSELIVRESTSPLPGGDGNRDKNLKKAVAVVATTIM